MSVAHDTTDRQHYAAQGKERDLELAVASLEALEGKHVQLKAMTPLRLTMSATPTPRYSAQTKVRTLTLRR